MSFSLVAYNLPTSFKGFYFPPRNGMFSSQFILFLFTFKNDLGE